MLFHKSLNKLKKRGGGTSLDIDNYDISEQADSPMKNGFELLKIEKI